METLLHDSETSRFPFESIDNSRDQFNKQIEDISRIFASNTPNFPEGYVCGELELAMELRLRGQHTNFHLIFTAIQDGSVGHSPAADSLNFHSSDESSSCCGNQYRVLVSSPYHVECPQRLIPSAVWLGLTKDGVQLRRNTGTPSLESVFEVSGILGEGETGSINFGFRRITGLGDSESDTVDGMIESRPEIAENISNDFLKLLRQFFEKANLEDSPASLFWVRLDKGLVHVRTSEESSGFPFQFGKVFLCPRDLAA